MDYAAIGAIFTFAGIQFVIGFNFHRTYLKLYSDFKAIIDKIAELRKGKFKDGLSALVSNIKSSQESGRTYPTFDVNDKFGSAYSIVENLVTQAKEPIELYTDAREHAEKAYRYTILSGVVTLSMILPQLSSEAIFGVSYFFTGIAFLWALASWIDYNGSMKKIVNLRDKGE
ncbi:MAG: hypothetical protein ACE14S_06930 [Candidatus Bathyarchaeia archaeon]